MKKVRKMLGKLEDQEVRDLMALIETQSNLTLARWGMQYALENYYPLYQQYKNHNEKLQVKIQEVQELLTHPQKQKIDLKELRQEASSIKDPIELASYRALITMLNIYNTPTNALGFMWYGAAAYAYSTLGVEAKDDALDQAARVEFKKAYDTLKKMAVENEIHPAKIKWGC